MENKEKELVLKAMQGDQMAYRMLYQIHEKAVRGRVNGYFQWKADADDVVLESFQKAFAALGSFDTEREFRPWLLTIATRTALDHLESIQRESQKKEGILHKADASEGNAPLTDFTPEEEIINDEMHERLMGYIDELPSLYKDVMIKYMIEELEYEEIARELGHSPLYIRVQLSLARKNLKKMLDETL